MGDKRVVELPYIFDRCGGFNYYCICLDSHPERETSTSIPLLYISKSGGQFVYWFSITEHYGSGVTIEMDGDNAIIQPTFEDDFVEHRIFAKRYETNFFPTKQEAENILSYLEKKYHVPEWDGSLESRKAINENDKYNVMKFCATMGVFDQC